MKEKLDNLFRILTRSELWVAAFVVLSAVYEAGVLPESWAKITAIVIALLGALGYGALRTVKKIGVAKADAVIAAATAANPTRAPQ